MGSRVPRGAFERLELHEWKHSRVVLRGGGGGNATSLPGGGEGDLTSLPDRSRSRKIGPACQVSALGFVGRLDADIVLDDSARSTKIPAMLLQPIVENAIKFGLYDTTGEVIIYIHALQDGGQLVIKVRNPFDASTTVPNKGTGFGLSSVERRLDLLFGRRGLLETNIEDDNFTTLIRIPQQQ